jgi:putative glutamine amidotransferase
MIHIRLSSANVAPRHPTRLLAHRRERFVMELAAELLAGDVPCLAICLGAQMLQVAAGGSLWVDLPSQWEGELLEHRGGALHDVIPVPGGWLDRLWSGSARQLRSHHHQALRELAPGYVVEARAGDGVIEAWRSERHPFLVGTQWHPEVQTDELGGEGLLRSFLEHCREHRE